MTRFIAGPNRKSASALAATLACAAAAVLATWPVVSTGADDENPVSQGRRTYTSTCARCHGINLVTTGSAFDLKTFPRDDKERFLRSVNKGLRAMPAWEANLSPEQIETIWSYILSVQSDSQ